MRTGNESKNYMYRWKNLLGNKRKEEKPARIVSAWCKEDGFCVGQKAVGEKRNEITAIPNLLDELQVKGQIITIDAMGTQKEIEEKIRDKRADYVLAVKGNQRRLHEEVRKYFAEESFSRKIRKEGGKNRRRDPLLHQQFVWRYRNV